MSDDSFDDSLLDDFEEDNYDEEKKEFQSSLLKGLGIGIAVTIFLELGVGLALNVDTNLVHRYIAFMLGLIPIFIAAIFTRSILKMFFIGAPVLVLTSFALPFFLPNIFSGLMTPFLTLIPIISEGNEILTTLGVVGENTAPFIDPILQYGIALDFVFGVLVGLFAAIGITGIVKIITQKPNLLTIFSFIFSMVFFIIGVIILPYILVVTSGIAHFGMAFSVGGAYLAEGTTISSTPGSSLDDANEMFTKAQDWFIEAEQMLEGLQAMGLFSLLGSANPNIQTIVSNGIVLMNAAVDLAKGVAPALAGFGAISRGMNVAMESLENSSSSASLLSLSQTDQEFQRGLDLVEQGFANFTQAVPNIYEAINTIENDMDREALESSLQQQNVDVQETLDYIFSSLPLLELTLGVFTNDDSAGLIDDPDGIEDDTRRAPIIHLLLGAKVMTEVQEQIGGSSSFEGTGPIFQDLIYHLNFVVSALDPQNNPAVDDLDNFTPDQNAPDQIVSLSDDIKGTVAFLRDAGNTTISIGRFGIVASPTLQSMNSTLSILTGSTDFTNLTASQYDEAIAVFDGTDPDVTYGIVQNASRMQNIANNTGSQIDALDTQSTNEAYGFFNTPAQDFVTQFREFDLLKNANNFYYISNGFTSLLKGVKDLTDVDYRVQLIKNNVTIIQQEMQNAQADAGDGNITQAQNHVTNASNAVDTIELEIIDTNNTLQVSKSHLVNASTSLNNTQDMPQLEETSSSLASISVHMTNIQIGNGSQGLTGISQVMTSIDGHIQTIQGTSDPPTIQAEINAIIADISDLESHIDYIEDEFLLIQSDLSGVSIAAQ